jgi:hypothetical protein
MPESLEQEFVRVGLENQRLLALVEDLRLVARGLHVEDERVWSSLGVPLRQVPHLDKPNQDRIVRRYRLFERDAPDGLRSDTRMYLDVQGLERLLEVARRSLTQRVAVQACVVEFEDRVTDAGHQYRVLKFDGVVEPER